MKRFFAATVVAAGLASVFPAFACGDKLLAIGRGVRFQKFYAARTAHLVIYAASTRTGPSLESSKLQKRLKGAVRKVDVAYDSSQLELALRSGQIDILLVSAADIPDLARKLQSSASSPVILPVVAAKAGRAEVAAMEKQYRRVVKADADEVGYLSAIEDAMKMKSKANAKS